MEHTNNKNINMTKLYNYEEFTNINKNIIPIYRYKFSPMFIDELYKFSKIHQYDHRKDFKEAWENWIKEKEELVEEEVCRTKQLGYVGDVLDKMFKSARYYFRKKSTEKHEPAKRRTYVGLSKELLEKMDNHIQSNLDSKNFKPSEGFEEFCNLHTDLLKEHIIQLIKNGITDSNEMKQKVKKTYKNRYYLNKK
jgi:hypothetical protein